MSGTRSFAVCQESPPQTGCGDSLWLMNLSDGTIDLEVVRSSKRADNRGRRSISMRLNRSEALALGRQLIAEASGLGAIDRPAGDFKLHVNTWNQDARGLFMASVSAALVADMVVLSMDRYRRVDGQLGFDGDMDMIFSVEDMRGFARSLLTVCRG